jgi:FkbM family methyltransferase
MYASHAMHALTNLAGRASTFARRKVIDFIASRARFDLLTMSRLEPTPIERLGSRYGGWKIPSSFLNGDSVAYCAGAGEDITFDVALIQRFGCHVYTIDPTPRAKAHVARTAPSDDRFHFLDVGLWDRDEVLKFYAPADPAHVSHSALNLQHTSEFFEAPVKRLSTLMREHGHTKLGLLKLDIEGAEYRVLDSLIADGVKADVICVEYDEALLPLDAAYLIRIRRSAYALMCHGYSLVAVEPACKLTFVSKELLPAKNQALRLWPSSSGP